MTMTHDDKPIKTAEVHRLEYEAEAAIEAVGDIRMRPITGDARPIADFIRELVDDLIDVTARLDELEEVG